SEILAGAAFGHRWRYFAGDAGFGDVLGDDEYDGLEQTRVDVISSAGVFAPKQRRKNTDYREHCTGDVDDRGSGAQRHAGRTSHISKPAHHLRRLVQKIASFIWPRQESTDATGHDSRICLLEILIRKSQAFEHARPVIINHDIGGLDELQKGIFPLFAFEIDGYAALARIEGKEIALVPAAIARLVPGARTLYLDDIGAKLREDHGCNRASDDMAKLQHADSLQWKR